MQFNFQEIFKSHLRLEEGMSHADLGSGSALHVPFKLAELVGDEGKVYCLDIQKSALSAIKAHARYYGHYHVETVWTDLEVYGGAKEIDDHSMDTLSMINLLHQIQQHEHVFNEANRLLKSGGRCVIIDWHSDHDLTLGPDEEQCLTLDNVRQMAQFVKWQEEKTFEPDPYHYGVVFYKI